MATGDLSSLRGSFNNTQTYQNIQAIVKKTEGNFFAVHAKKGILTTSSSKTTGVFSGKKTLSVDTAAAITSHTLQDISHAVKSLTDGNKFLSSDARSTLLQVAHNLNSLSGKVLTPQVKARLEREITNLTERLNQDTMFKQGVITQSRAQLKESREIIQEAKTVLNTLNSKVAEGQTPDDVRLKKEMRALIKDASTIREQAKTTLNQMRTDDAVWAEKTCPQMKRVMVVAKQVLAASENSTTPLDVRLSCAPEKPSSGMGFTFFIKTAIAGDPGNSSSLGVALLKPSGENGITLKNQCIVKPTSKETAATAGVPKGQGGIRERLAFKAQELLGLDCGVPPTMMTVLNHHSFNGETKIDLLAKKLFNYGFSLTPKELKALAKNSESEGAFTDSLKAQAPKRLKVEVEQHTLDFLFTINHDVGLSLEIGVAWDEIHHPQAEQAPALVSCQRLASKCVSLEEMNDVDNKTANEIQQICPKQFEKFALDMIMLNKDGNLGNVLAQKVSTRTLHEHISQHPGMDAGSLEAILSRPEPHDVEKNVKDLLNQLKGNKNFINSQKFETNLHNLCFAVANNYKSTYNLVLIDHSASLPSAVGNAAERRQALRGIHHPWEGLPQCAASFSGLAKTAILELDIDQFVDKMKEDQKMHEAEFGSDCHVDSSCYDLLRINLLFLKKGVKQDLSIKAINSCVAGVSERRGDTGRIYEQFCTTMGKIDWKAVENAVTDTIKLKKGT